jgi:type IV secretory pathway VirJ component
LSISVLACALLCACGPGEETFTHGRFGQVVTIRPRGEVKSVAMLLTDRDGWTAGAGRVARALARDGALVIGIPLPVLYAELEKKIEGCEFTDGDLENLSHFAQAYYKLPAYVAPILVGYGEGAAFVYANLAQSPVGTFAGAVTLGFCPRIELRQQLCADEGFASRKEAQGFSLQPPVKLPASWIALQGDADSACPIESQRKFIAGVSSASVVPQPNLGRDFSATAWLEPLRRAYAELAANHIATAPPPASLGDLPVVEVPAQQANKDEPFAVLWSGDGGWAGLDEEVAAALSARGIPVVGVDSLRYFWEARTPEKIAADLDRIIRYYSRHWQREQVLLIGYSQGADVLPFAFNRLPAESRGRVRLVAAMALSDHALFEFHLSSWLSDDDSGPETRPEVERITGAPFLCIYGEEEDDSVCPELRGPAVQAIKLAGGHHFDGDYGRLAEEILKAVR